MKQHLTWIFLLAFFIPDVVSASSMHCGTKVVRVGDTAAHVRSHCGEPIAVERETRLFANGATLGERCFTGSVNIERWIYKRGGNSTVVTVVEGRVERIRPQTGGFERGWRSPC